MRKFITSCVEFETGKDQLKTLITKEPIDNKQKILSYLKAGEDDGVRCSSVHDYVTDEYTGSTIHLYTDGEYFWDDEEIYHFEKYNIPLTNDFLQKVANYYS